ncbi:MAG: DUF4097 family beta strand repeat-containing protein [Acidimicrobiales bacterium]
MMRYPATALDRSATYRAAQHDTLNFEACGGEPWSADDLELRPDAKVIPFPMRIAKRVITLNHRKETRMSKKNSVPEEPESRRATTSGLERRETFVASGPVLATVTSKSGDVKVRTTTGSNLEVTLRATSSSAHLLDLAEVHFNESTGTLEVRTRDGGGPGKKMERGSWFSFGDSDLDVEIVIPDDSALEVDTVSGDTTFDGSFDDVHITSVSGDVRLNADVNAADVKTASGDVDARRVHDTLRCRTASGDVNCESAAQITDISSASGDVRVVAEQPGELSIKVVSGDVLVRVARGLAVDINGNTVSGDMGTNIDLDGGGDSGGSEELAIKVSTVSGDVRIDKAS